MCQRRFSTAGFPPAAPPCALLAAKNSFTCAALLLEDLHAALAEVADAELEDFADLLRRRRLGDGDERNLTSLALRLGAMAAAMRCLHLVQFHRPTDLFSSPRARLLPQGAAF
jgi:hypothetical protein